MPPATADMYLPRGIKEAVRDDGTALTHRERPTHQASVGIQELEAVRNGAKYTLRGLLAFQWSANFLALGNYAALAAAALLAVAVFNAGAGQAAAGSMDGGLVGLGGWIAGSFAFILWLVAAWMALQGIRHSHRGRAELGALQRREVEAAERAFYRGIVILVVGSVAAVTLAFQETTWDNRASIVPYATLVGFGVAVATGVLASASFGSFFGRYIRNMMTGNAKKKQRRFRRAFMLGWTLPIAIAVAGIAAVSHANEFGCNFDPTDCGGQQWSLSAPSYGPAFYLVSELVYDQYMDFYTAMGIVVGGLLVSRAIGVFVIGSYRGQLRTAELVLRAHIRANAPAQGALG